MKSFQLYETNKELLYSAFFDTEVYWESVLLLFFRIKKGIISDKLGYSAFKTREEIIDAHSGIEPLIELVSMYEMHLIKWSKYTQ